MALLSAQNVTYIISALLKMQRLRQGEVKSPTEGHSAPNLSLSNSKACGYSRPVHAARAQGKAVTI